MNRIKTAILSLIYLEPSWVKTCSCIADLAGAYPIYYADRGGSGGLAPAFDAAFLRYDLTRYRFVWFLTNVTWTDRHLLQRLEEGLEQDTTLAAITPSFYSDHLFLRPQKDAAEETTFVPFVEFTCPLVRTDVYRRIGLDVEMPYTGHDVDWGFRVLKAGFRLAVHHKASVEHAYLRHLGMVGATALPITTERQQRRKAAEGSTTKRLLDKWGPNWREILSYHGRI